MHNTRETLECYTHMFIFVHTPHLFSYCSCVARMTLIADMLYYMLYYMLYSLTLAVDMLY